MYYSRVRRNRIRKVKALLVPFSIITIMVLALLLLSKLDNNRPWTYEECVKTYYGSHPDYIARQCNYLR